MNFSIFIYEINEIYYRISELPRGQCLSRPWFPAGPIGDMSP